MPTMTQNEIDGYLAQPLLAVLAVGRPNRGPVAVPLWYEYVDGVFRVVTSRDSLHGRLMERYGRATLTVRSEDYGDAATVERYVMAEGSVQFIEDDVQPQVRRMRRRYYTGPRASDWVDRPLPPFTLTQEIALLRPERISGYEWRDSLD